MRESAGATQSGRVATRKRRRIKLWEEPDQKLVTDDVRGGSCSFLGGVAITPPRAPQLRFRFAKHDPYQARIVTS